MMVLPWDAARSTQEWQDWLAQGHDFGMLQANGYDGGYPVAVPTHFFFGSSGQLVTHLARPNSVWEAVAANPKVAFAVVDDYAFIPGPWRLAPEMEPDAGVPTSYYSAVVFHGTASVVSDAEGKAALLAEQMARFQPDGGYGEIAAGSGPYHRMLGGIRFLVIDVDEVQAKFKFDDHKGPEHQERVGSRLAERGRPLDLAAKRQLERRVRERPGSAAGS
jgi:transcriptional regulator